MNIFAGSGALLLSLLSDKIQEYKLTIAYTIGLSLTGIATALAPTKMDSWIAGIAFSFFIGPVQTSSRTVYAKLCPENNRAELFGIFVFSGKASAFIGPAMYSSFIYYCHSQRIGMMSAVIMIAVALVLLVNNKTMLKPEPINEYFQVQ